MHRNAGFTLLEVIVAFIIAGLALGVMFHGVGVGLSSARISSQYEEALSRARSHLAMVGHGTPIQVGDDEGDDGGGYHFHLHVQRIGTTQPQIFAGANGRQDSATLILYAVEVDISWSGGGRLRQVTLQSERLGPVQGGP